MSKTRSDKIFFLTTVLLCLFGLFILISASLSLILKDGADFNGVIRRQIILGVLFGFFLLNVTSRVSYKNWRKLALPIFIISIFLTALVFAPKIGFAYGGAKRWLSFGPIFFQPSEALKFGFVAFFALWLSNHKAYIGSFTKGLLPFFVILAVPAVLLYLEPDLGTFGVLAFTGGFMYMLAGGKKRYLLFCLGLGLIFITGIYFLKPHARERILVFIHPTADTLGKGYQLQQSKIAIGSGGFFGRGFGLSLQKFDYLPQPIGDSIFAVFSEEFGFLGGFVLISLFLFFAYRGLKISALSQDAFGRLLGSGVVILIVMQAYINIASMVGVVPLTGLPLTFVSQGGTALAVALAEVGVVLNISKTSKI